MKKFLVFASIILVLFLAACGTSDSNQNQGNEQGNEQENQNEAANNNEQNENEAADEEPNVEIKIGASSTPHAEILEEAKPLLEEKGIALIIEEYQDYILPNDDLDNGTLDGNYFQHIPYLEQTIADTGYEIESLGGIHIEPMGIYSKTIESLDDIEDGTEVILSNSVAEHGRILALLEKGGLITLNDTAESIDDIVDNPKDLKFSPDYDPAFLPELYHSEEGTIIAINTNYAIDAGLNPLEDALVIEAGESPYANIIAVRSEDKDSEALNTLVDVLLSEEIQNFILEKYEGAVVPVQ